MKTTINYLTDESSTNLLRKLFELRLELDDPTYEPLNSYQEEVTHIIERIDDLFQMVIEDLSI